MHQYAVSAVNHAEMIFISLRFIFFDIQTVSRNTQIYLVRSDRQHFSFSLDTCRENPRYDHLLLHPLNIFDNPSALACAIAQLRMLCFMIPIKQLKGIVHQSRLAAPHGTSTRGTGDLDLRRRGTLTQIYNAASRGPLRCESRSPAPRVEVPCGAVSRGPWGQNKTQKF